VSLETIREALSLDMATAAKEWRPILSAASGTKKKSARGMKVKDANDEAMNLAGRNRKQFFAKSIRGQAKEIGCHVRTWQRTEFFKAAVRNGQIIPPKERAPKTVSITKKLEEVTGVGEKDEIQKEASRRELMHKLIAEQGADFEPSPLSDDPPGAKRKVHTHKRI
jgi:hypothetical protein